MLSFTLFQKKSNSFMCFSLLVFLTLLIIHIPFIAKVLVPLVIGIFIFKTIIDNNIYYKDKGMKAINY